MKNRLQEAALTRVKRAIARQQPVAEQPPRSTERAPLDEPVLMRHENLLDIVGMVEKKNAVRAEPDERDRAAFGARPGQKAERIAANLLKIAEKQTAARPGWKHTKSYPVTVH